MNRIYNVLWNRARQAYMVVSELAINRGKAPGGRAKKKAAILAAAMVLSMGLGFSGAAAQTVDDLESAGIVAGVVGSQNSIALGNNASVLVQADHAVAFGIGASIGTGTSGGVAMGAAHVGGREGVAIGYQSSVGENAYYSVALGAGSVADEANTVSVGGGLAGNRKIVHVADGGVYVGSTDAVNGSQLYVTNQNVASNTETLDGLAEAGILAGSPVGNPLSEIALGIGSTAHGESGTAVGVLADANGKYGTAIGSFAWVSENAENSVAVGFASEAHESNVFSVGRTGEERRIVNVVAGTADTDAVNVAQLKEKADAADLDGVVYWDDKNEGNHTIQGVKLEDGEAIGKDFKTSYKGGVVSLNEVYDRTSLIKRTDDYTTIIGDQVAVQAARGDGLGGLYVKGAESGTITKLLSDGSARIGELSISNDGLLSGVTKGDVSKTSTDAVNGSQLYATNQKVEENTAVIDAFRAAGVIAGETMSESSQSLALGEDSYVNGEYGVAIGEGSSVDGHNGTAIGSLSWAKNANATAVGSDSWAVGDNSTALGFQSFASGKEATALGMNSRAKGSRSTAVGEDSFAYADHATAVGEGSHVRGTNGTALGQGARVVKSAENAVALGAGSVATMSNTVSIGSTGHERRIVHVAAGVDDTDAVNMSQLKKKADAADLAGVVYWDDKNEGNHTIQGVKLENGVAIGTDFQTSYRGGTVSLNDVYSRTAYIEREDSWQATVIENQVAVRAGNDDKTGGLYIRGTNEAGLDVTVSALLEDGQLIAAGGKFQVGADGGFSAANKHFKVNADGTLISRAGDSMLLVSDLGAGLRSKGASIVVTDGQAGIAAGGNRMIIDENGSVFTDDQEESTTIKGSSITTGILHAGSIAVNDNGRITGLAAGVDDSDAVNMSQLRKVGAAAQKHTTVSVNDEEPDGNLVLNETENKDGGKHYDVSLSDTLKLSEVGSLSIGNQVSLNGSGLVVGETALVGGSLMGLSNTSFDFNKYNNGVYQGAERGYAATQGQLADAFGWLNQKIDDIELKGDGNVTVDKNPESGTGSGSGTEGSTKPNAPDWEIGLNKDKIDLGNVTIGGNTGNITANGNITGGTVSAGKTSISGDGVKVGESSILTENSLTVGGKEYIGKDGLNANSQKITNVADGKEKGDAVNFGQLQYVQDQVAGNSNAIDALGRSVNTLGAEIDSVGALSAALAGLHPLDYDPSDAKFQLSAAMGAYEGSSALALGGFYHINKDVLLSAGVSTVLKGERKTSGNVGITIRVGSGKTPTAMGDVGTLKEANQQLTLLKEDNVMLNEKVEELEAQLKELMAAVKQ